MKSLKLEVNEIKEDCILSLISASKLAVSKQGFN